LLLQIVKLGHDPALIFQDNLRRMRSFRRCTGLSECEVKSVRWVTLPWVYGISGVDKYGAPAGPPANSLAGRSPSLSVKLRATFRCSLWVNQPKLNDWIVDLSYLGFGDGTRRQQGAH
jgi:hypothetical protein